VVTFDLGGRVLEVTGIPGHHPASIAIYDPWSGFLLSGDTVYPGRLYVVDFPEFVASLDRLVDFASARAVTHVMGCHIEMSRRPGRDYPIGSPYQPDEPAIQMTVGQLQAVRDAARSVADKPGVHRFDDFIIFNGPCRAGVVRQLTRTAWRRLTRREGVAP
jgi:hydroxyacylglutathione hydrolase